MAYLNKFGKIFCISDAQIFGKIEAIFEDGVNSASPKSASFVRPHASLGEFRDDQKNDEPTAEDGIRLRSSKNGVDTSLRESKEVPTFHRDTMTHVAQPTWKQRVESVS
jgi:hypothetical protein